MPPVSWLYHFTVEPAAPVAVAAALAAGARAGEAIPVYEGRGGGEPRTGSRCIGVDAGEGRSGQEVAVRQGER